MTESVQACQEGSTELFELILETKLLTKEEVILMEVKRNSFEHEIKTYSNDAEEQYVRYISYDWDLMEMIQRRKDKSNLSGSKKENMAKKTETIIMMFGNNINHLFQDLLGRFPNNLKNWAWYLEFCRKMKMHKASYNLVDILIKVHGDKPIAFAFAAEWTLLRRHNYELARTYLLQGLHSHRDSHDLYLELLKNELEFTSMLKEKYATEVPSEKDTLRDDLLRGLNCKLVFEDARNSLGVNAKTVPLFKSMYDMMKKYEFTKEFQTDIIRDILERVPACEQFHDVVARSHLVTKLDASHTTPYPMPEIEKCYAAYRSILDGTCSSELMWSLALDFLEAKMKLIKNEEDGNQLKTWYLETASEAHDKDKLSVNQCITWMKMLRQDKQLEKLVTIQAHVLEKERFYNSADIWLCVLKYKISTNEPDSQIYDLFKRGSRVLQDKALPLFLNVIAYFMPHDPKITMEIFEIGINMSHYPDICRCLRVKYLEWLVLTKKSRNEARLFYLNFKVKEPYCLALHQTMYKVEWAGGHVGAINRNHMNQICELAAIQFGRNNIEVWIDWIRHDIAFNKGENMSTILSKARSYMDHSIEMLSNFDIKVLELCPTNVLERSDDTESMGNMSEVPPSRLPPSRAGSRSQLSSHSEYNSVAGGLDNLTYYSPGGAESTRPPIGNSSVRTVDSYDL